MTGGRSHVRGSRRVGQPWRMGGPSGPAGVLARRASGLTASAQRMRGRPRSATLVDRDGEAPIPSPGP